MYQPAREILHLWPDAEAPRNLPRPSANAEAGYCLMRAAVEAQRAVEATHPLAQRAHQQMASLYRQRALASSVGE